VEKIQVCLISKKKTVGKFTLTNIYIRVIGLYYGDRPCSEQGTNLDRRNTRRRDCTVRYEIRPKKQLIV